MHDMGCLCQGRKTGKSKGVKKKKNQNFWDSISLCHASEKVKVRRREWLVEAGCTVSSSGSDRELSHPGTFPGSAAPATAAATSPVLTLLNTSKSSSSSSRSSTSACSRLQDPLPPGIGAPPRGLSPTASSEEPDARRSPSIPAVRASPAASASPAPPLRAHWLPWRPAPPRPAQLLPLGPAQTRNCGRPWLKARAGSRLTDLAPGRSQAWDSKSRKPHRSGHCSPEDRRLRSRSDTAKGHQICEWGGRIWTHNELTQVYFQYLKVPFFPGLWFFFPPSESVFIETNAKIKDTRTPWVLIDFFFFDPVVGPCGYFTVKETETEKLFSVTFKCSFLLEVFLKLMCKNVSKSQGLPASKPGYCKEKQSCMLFLIVPAKLKLAFCSLLFSTYFYRSKLNEKIECKLIYARTSFNFFF